MIVNSGDETTGTSITKDLHTDPTFSAKYLLLAGMAAPLVYAATVILGGLLTPDYSHVDQAISELTATGALRRGQVEMGFVFYNVLVVLFAVGLLFRTRHWSRMFRWGSLTASILERKAPLPQVGPYRAFTATPSEKVD